MDHVGRDLQQAGTDAVDRFPGILAYAVLHPSSSQDLLRTSEKNSLALPGLELSKPCDMGLGQKLQSALTDHWAVYPGTTGLLFGASSGALAKHYALGPSVDLASRQFKIARAGFIWGLAGFAANYVGGSIASFLSTNDKLESCQRGMEIDSLRIELNKQGNTIEGLSKRLNLLSRP